MHFAALPFRFARTTASVAAALVALACAPHAVAVIPIAATGHQSPAFPRQYAPGAPIQFTITSTLSYASIQWFHNDVAIPGATSATFTLTNPSAADSGNYQVKATLNGTPDASAFLTINVLPFPGSAIDPTFNAAIPADLRVSGVFPGAADGSFIVQTYPAADVYDSTQHHSVIRLNPDGSRDPSVFLQINNNSVSAVLPSGDLIMSGTPHRVGLDGTPKTFDLPAAFNAAGSVYSIVQPDGKIIVQQENLIARLNADGTVDSSFNAVPLPGLISGTRLDSAGRILVSGSYTDPVYTYVRYVFVRRLLPNGQEDPGFKFSPWTGTSAVEVYPLSDGGVFVRYFIFSHEGPYLSRLKPDGTTDAGWGNGGIFDSLALVVDAANSRIYYLDFMGVLRRTLVTATGLVDDPTFYPGETYDRSLQLTADGKLFAGVYRLLTDQTASTLPPTVSVSPSSYQPIKGSTVTFTSKVTGTGPFTYQWLALDGQKISADTTAPTLVIPNFDLPQFGRYQLRVTGAAGAILSDVITIGYDTFLLPYLANLSGRAYVGTGDDIAIAGLAVKINAGARGISMLMRGVGPSLQPYGVNAFLPNPAINLYDAGRQLIANNDTWGDTSELRDSATKTGAFPFPGNSNDAAMIQTLRTSNATLQLVDQTGANGVGLLEIYRVPIDPPVPGDIVNLSLRARTGSGEKVATAGFVIVDPQGFGRSARVVLRAIGPTLSQSGVAFPLSDPVLTLYRGDSTIVAQNDNWSSNVNWVELGDAMHRVGAFDLPFGSKDAAMVLDLPAGVYSIQSTGAVGTPDTGVTLLEIYLVR